MIKKRSNEGILNVGVKTTSGSKNMKYSNSCDIFWRIPQSDFPRGRMIAGSIVYPSVMEE
jgi:hypothetical protein